MNRLSKAIVVVSVAAGAGLGATAVVSAATSSPAVVVEHGSAMRGQSEGMAAVADLLNMTPEELHTAMREGKSLAQIATEKSVDVDKVIEVLVAEAKTRITEMVNTAPTAKPADGSGRPMQRRGMHREGMRG